jgi:integrase
MRVERAGASVRRREPTTASGSRPIDPLLRADAARGDRARDVKRFGAQVAARGVAANTVRLALAPVKALFATAVEEGVIRANPTVGVRIAEQAAAVGFEEEGERVKALTENELAALLGKLPDTWRLFFTFLAQTGLRIGEAIALQWGDVDLGQRRLHVRRRLYRGAFAPRRAATDVAPCRSRRRPPKRSGGFSGSGGRPGRTGSCSRRRPAGR